MKSETRKSLCTVLETDGKTRVNALSKWLEVTDKGSSLFHVATAKLSVEENARIFSFNAAVQASRTWNAVCQKMINTMQNLPFVIAHKLSGRHQMHWSQNIWYKSCTLSIKKIIFGVFNWSKSTRDVTSEARSAPLKPSQRLLSPIAPTSTSGLIGTFRTNVRNMDARPAGSGNPTYSCVSNRPGLSKAGSIMSGLQTRSKSES